MRAFPFNRARRHTLDAKMAEQRDRLGVESPVKGHPDAFPIAAGPPIEEQKSRLVVGVRAPVLNRDTTSRVAVRMNVGNPAARVIALACAIRLLVHRSEKTPIACTRFGWRQTQMPSRLNSPTSVLTAQLGCRRAPASRRLALG